MSFYKEQSKAFTALHSALETSYNNKIDVNIDYLIYQLLINYAVSGSSLKKQIERYAKQHDLEIKNDVLVMSR